MAEVRLRCSRGAYNFALKTYNRHLFESQNKQSESAISASSLSAAFLLGDIQNGERYGAENDREVSQDSYTRVTQLFGNVVGNVAENHNSLGLNKENLLSNKSQFQNIEESLPRINDRFPRTLFTFRSAHQQQILGLCWGHPGQLVFTRAYSGNGTRSEPLYKTKTGYYEILDVSSTATHAQIKTAYYKQSFTYHPDRNAGIEHATVRFSEISEAYTVLGNKALRKKYDRGLLSPSDLLTAKPSAKDTGSSAKQHTESRRSVVDHPKGGSDIDKFIKTHYLEQLQREKNNKVRREEMLRLKEETFRERRMDRAMEVGVMMMVVIGIGLLMSLNRG